MVQLIYPSLLLVTIQLVSVSVGKPPQKEILITSPGRFYLIEKCYKVCKYLGRYGRLIVEMYLARSENNNDIYLWLTVKSGYIRKSNEDYHIYKNKWYHWRYNNYKRLKIPVPSNNRTTVNIKVRGTNYQLNVRTRADHEGDTSPKFYKESESWIDAFRMCQNLNSDLVQITNQTVQTEVKSLLKEQQGLQKGIWIGLERSIFGTNVKWKWISGSTDIYPLWNSSFPVNRLDNHCGKVVWDEITQEISLLDANCHERLPFICQGRK